MTMKLLAILGPILVAGVGLLAQPSANRGLFQGERVVVMVGGLSDEEFVACSATVAAVNPEAVLLLDSDKVAEANRQFLKRFGPTAVIPIGAFASLADLKKRYGAAVTEPLAWNHGPAEATGQALFRSAENVVVAPAGDRRLLLQAACLAATLRAPLLLARGEVGEKEKLRERIVAWKTRTIYGVGSAATMAPTVESTKLLSLADEELVVRTNFRQLNSQGKGQVVVVANPADAASGQGKMSLIAPWLAVQKHGVLALTNSKGTNTAAAVEQLAEKLRLQPDTLIIAATLTAIPTERRPNPVMGKDVDIEMEPLTPEGETPFSFATGRLFHQDPGIVLVQLARNRLLKEGAQSRKALVVSNPGGGLPLLETFSRHTARELRNAGYQTTAWFGDDVSKETMRRILPNQDVFLWEGHYRTLVDEFKFLTWNEPLTPSLFFLQSCLALKEEEAGPLVERGAVAVVGSSTRTYSATGGSFTLAFFNAMLYDEQTLGGALRQAKNFLLTYSLLKEKRLGEKAKLKGVNVRSSWAFTLWGDPTLRLPHPPPPDGRLDSVRKQLRAGRLTITLPEDGYEKVSVGKYEARMLPNARLAGLLRIDAENEDNRVLVPFLFAEVHLAKVPAGSVPRLTSRIPDRNWVFTWDERRKCGYLLVTPRAKDEEELRFRVEWES